MAWGALWGALSSARYGNPGQALVPLDLYEFVTPAHATLPILTAALMDGHKVYNPVFDALRHVSTG